jgi:hypothetical protein
MAEADQGWRECQRHRARRLDAVHIAADTGGHPVQIDQPKLLAAIVQAVLEAARDRSGLSIAAAVVKDAGGTLLR